MKRINKKPAGGRQEPPWGCLLGLGALGLLTVLGYWTHWTLAVALYSVYLIAQSARLAFSRKRRAARGERSGDLSLLARFAGLWHLVGDEGEKPILLNHRALAERRGLHFTDSEWKRLGEEQEAFWGWYYERFNGRDDNGG